MVAVPLRASLLHTEMAVRPFDHTGRGGATITAGRRVSEGSVRWRSTSPRGPAAPPSSGVRDVKERAGQSEQLGSQSTATETVGGEANASTGVPAALESRRISHPEGAPGQVEPDAVVPTSRGNFYDLPLDVSEHDRLRALNAATSTRAEANLAVLDAMESLRAAYRPSVRTDEIEARLRPGLVDGPEDLRAVLDSLAEWELVVSALDRSHRHVQRLADFYRAQLVWQITPKGQAVLAAARSVLDAIVVTGGLRRRILGELRRRLDELVEAVAADDAAATFLTLRTLDVDLGDLTRSAQDFTATLARLTDATDIDPGEFAIAKRVLVDYLSSFSADLYVFRGHLAERARTLDAFGAARIAGLAADGDDSATVALGGDAARGELVESWRARWVGMYGWLAGDDANGVSSGVDELFEALTEATNSILAHVRRMSEAEQRRVSRAGDLVNLAGSFASSTPVDADRLFDATFGLGQAPRLAGHGPELGPGRRPSWFTGPVLPITVSVRSRGASTGTGRMARVVDYGAERRALAAQAEVDAARRRAAAAELAAGLDGAELSEGSFELLLDALGQAIGALREVGEAEAMVEGVTVRLCRDPAWGTTVRSATGELRAPGVVISVVAPDDDAGGDADNDADDAGGVGP